MKKSCRLKLLIILAFILLIGSISGELFGQADIVRVRRIVFDGNQHFSSAHLRSLMEVRSKSLIDQFLIWKKDPIFEESVLEGDLRRIERNYQRAGYLNIKIGEPELIYNRPGTRVTVKITLKEGIRVRVRNIDFRFPESSSSTFKDEQIIALKRRLNLKEHSHFRDIEFRDDLNIITLYFDGFGYPFINVNFELFLTDSEEEVDITYLVNPGPKAYIGDVYFSGLNKISEDQLTGILNVRTGQEYGRKRLEQTRTRLQSLGVFQYVSVNLRLDSVQEQVPVEITVRENDTVLLNFGVGYEAEIDEIDKMSDFFQERRFRYFAEISRLRFLGGLRKGTLLIKRSYLEPIHVNFKLFQPAFPTIHSNVILNPFYRQEREPGYRIKRIGGNTTLNYRVSGRTSTYLTYTFEDNNLIASAETSETSLSDSRNFSDIPDWNFNQEDFSNTFRNDYFTEGYYNRNISDSPKYYRKSYITWGVLRDSSYPAFYPRKGSLLSNAITLSGIGFGSDFRYLRVISEGRLYQAIAPDLVLALRLKGGAIKGLAEGEYIPIEDRFYAGGTYSVRGWSRSDIGPKSEEGQPLGGKSLVEGSIEFRHPIVGPLSAVAFFDYGNVWEETYDHDLSDLRYAAGGGLRIGTPVGPFRIDIGTPVGEGSKPIQLFISIGQAF